MANSSVLYAIVFCKCPRCHEGNLYSKSYWRGALDIFRGEYNMHENCPRCGQHYEIEIGFWWGAMYVAYALSSGALLIVGLISMLVLKLNEWQILAVILGTALMGFSYNARIARSIWANVFIDFDPQALSSPNENADSPAHSPKS